MSSIQFGPRVFNAYPAWYVTRGDAQTEDRASLAQCCCLTRVRTLPSENAQTVFLVARCPNRLSRARTVSPRDETDAFCTKHFEDWKDTIGEYHTFVPERNPETHTIETHHATIDLADLMEAYKRRVFLLRWFCAMDFHSDAKHRQAIRVLQNVICGRPNGEVRLLVAKEAYVLKIVVPNAAPRTLAFELPPLPSAPRVTDVAALDLASMAEFPSLGSSQFGPPGGHIDVAYFPKKRRTTSDRTPDPKRLHMDIHDVAVDPMKMSQEECQVFVNAAHISGTFAASTLADDVAWKWYSVYECQRIGVLFEGSRIVIGVSRETRAAGNDTFEVDFDTDRGIEAFRHVDGAWTREPPLTTYVFRCPPSVGHPMVYMGADADALRQYAADAKRKGTPPVKTAETRCDYRL